MRDCLRNQRVLWYSLYLRKEPVYKEGLTDPDGNPIQTGQFREIYTDPLPVRAHVTSAVGPSEIEAFGSSIQYDRVISTVNRLGLTEQSRLWIERSPADGAPDYRVKRVAEGLNQNLYAIERLV